MGRERMVAKKIDAMHSRYGTLDGVKCKTCPHLDAYSNADYTRIWYKCKMYGVTSGEGTDWRVGWEACGAFCVDPEDAKKEGLYGEVYRTVRGLRERKPDPECDGQTKMEF